LKIFLKEKWDTNPGIFNTKETASILFSVDIILFITVLSGIHMRRNKPATDG
jgi:hypothetical protein